MLIYIEGIDRSGKTSFIREYSQYLNVPSYRKEPPILLKPDEYHSYFKGVGFTLVELHKFFNQDLIIDRSFISDWIYSNREKDLFDISIWREWEERHLQLQIDVILLYFEIDKTIFNERTKNQRDPYMNIDDFDRYTELYETYLSDTHFKYIRLPGTIPFAKQLEIVFTSLNELKFK